MSTERSIDTQEKTHVEVFLNLQLPEMVHRDFIEQTLKGHEAVSQLMISGMEQEIDVSFQLDPSHNALNPIMEKLSHSGVATKSMIIHLPQEVTGLRDYYDAIGAGDLVDGIREVDGVADIGISSNGTIKLMLTKSTLDEDHIIRVCISITSEFSSKKK